MDRDRPAGEKTKQNGRDAELAASVAVVEPEVIAAPYFVDVAADEPPN